VLADQYQGKRLNSPNDLVVKSDGMIYFTDPPYGIAVGAQELSFNGVYHLNPENRELALLTDNFNRPNGLTFSPDEKLLYISDSSARRHIKVFSVDSDGMLINSCLFTEIYSELSGNPDGMKTDIEGNLYVAAAGGIWVFSKDGETLGIIEVPDPKPTNCAWGDTDWRSLFIAARTSVYRIRFKIPGAKSP